MKDLLPVRVISSYSGGHCCMIIHFVLRTAPHLTSQIGLPFWSADLILNYIYIYIGFPLFVALSVTISRSMEHV